jgi:hypothetical protein
VAELKEKMRTNLRSTAVDGTNPLETFAAVSRTV